MYSASEAFLYCFDLQKYVQQWHLKVPPALGSPLSWVLFRLATLCEVLAQFVALFRQQGGS